MRIGIHGIGVWGRGMRNWPEFIALVTNADGTLEANWQAPAPTSIPTRERRRAPLMVKLAVEVANQACDMAHIDPQHVATVFSSSMGDTDITDYMCRSLAGESKVLSPTRFHNSVHNAPAGYWSISAANRAPTSSIASSRESFSAALIEASTLSVVEQRPVLLISSDIAVPGPLGNVYPIGEPFGAALTIDATNPGDDPWEVSISPASDTPQWPVAQHPLLQSISEVNPAARSLALLAAIATDERGTIRWPLHDAMFVQMSRGEAES
jgi:hypothetical protein